ncbi:MAG TPA: o-succinylbenzoate synthase [Chloroflexota bacterium]
MRIESIDLRQVQLELTAPFTTSFGTTLKRACLIVAVTAEGETGLGECVAFDGPWYSYETIATAWHIMSDFLVPRLLAKNFVEPEDVWTVFAPIRGHNMAKAALEMACWDLFARCRGVSLTSLLGGTRERVPVGVSVGIQPSPEALVDVVGGYLDDGYQRIKLKIAPGTDIEFVTAVRRAYPDAQVQVDANSAYTLADEPTFRQMDQFELLLIEQPLGPDDIVDHARLQRDLATPICLDESIHSPDDARHALDLGSCRIINIKPGRVGGHRQSRAIHDLCLSRGVPVWCGGMLETNIGRAHNVALASLPGFSLPGDISASARYYEHDIAGPGFDLNEDSTITVPGRPGIGVDLESKIAWERRDTFRSEHRIVFP